MVRDLLILLFLLSTAGLYAQQAPGIVLDASVNNSTIDTCGVDFFDNGGHTLHC